jgi:hypothetical protein
MTTLPLRLVPPAVKVKRRSLAISGRDSRVSSTASQAVKRVKLTKSR